MVEPMEKYGIARTKSNRVKWRLQNEGNECDCGERHEHLLICTKIQYEYIAHLMVTCY